MTGEFPPDMHGTTRGKLYAFKDDGRCPECLVEACERQQTGGLGAGFPRKVLLGSLAFDRPAEASIDRANRSYEWTVQVRPRGE